MFLNTWMPFLQAFSYRITHFHMHFLNARIKLLCFHRKQSTIFPGGAIQQLEPSRGQTVARAAQSWSISPAPVIHFLLMSPRLASSPRELALLTKRIMLKDTLVGMTLRGESSISHYDRWSSSSSDGLNANCVNYGTTTNQVCFHLPWTVPEQQRKVLLYFKTITYCNEFSKLGRNCSINKDLRSGNRNVWIVVIRTLHLAGVNNAHPFVSVSQYYFQFGEQHPSKIF